MPLKTPQVLLIGSAVRSAGQLADWLRSRGCTFHLAHSFAEAKPLLRAASFDLVLCEAELFDATVHDVIALLDGSPTTLFYWLAVQDSCWWLPALERGEPRWGTPALRPHEFSETLDQLLDEFRVSSPEPADEEDMPGESAVAEKPTVVPPKRTPPEHIATRKRSWSA